MLAERVLGFRAEGRTVVLVTHDLDQALALGDEFILLSRGHVIRSGAIANVSLEELESLYHTTVDTDAALSLHAAVAL